MYLYPIKQLQFIHKLTCKPDIANAWQLTGKLGFKSPQKAGSVNLNWHQSGADYQLKLSGPLGTGSAQITGNKDQIKVTRGTEHYMGTPKSIALQWLLLPVDAIAGTRLAIAEPGETTHKTFDSAGNPQSFDQAGWKLTFPTFQLSINSHYPKHQPTWGSS